MSIQSRFMSNYVFIICKHYGYTDQILVLVFCFGPGKTLSDIGQLSDTEPIPVVAIIFFKTQLNKCL